MHGRNEICIQYFDRKKNMRVRANSEELGVDGRIILELVVEKLFGKLWNGFVWFSIGTNDELLRTQ
jgi:hypothetical protein